MSLKSLANENPSIHQRETSKEKAAKLKSKHLSQIDGYRCMSQMLGFEVGASNLFIQRKHFTTCTISRDLQMKISKCTSENEK